ncbi:hypothetical protein ACPZ19_12060 [Amycolatopsis lurida]
MNKSSNLKRAAVYGVAGLVTAAIGASTVNAMAAEDEKPESGAAQAAPAPAPAPQPPVPALKVAPAPGLPCTVQPDDLRATIAAYLPEHLEGHQSVRMWVTTSSGHRVVSDPITLPGNEPPE